MQKRDYNVAQFFQYGRAKHDINQPTRQQTGQGGDTTKRTVPPKIFLQKDINTWINDAKKFVKAHDKELKNTVCVDELSLLRTPSPGANEALVASTFHKLMGHPLEMVLEKIPMPEGYQLAFRDEIWHGQYVRTDMILVVWNTKEPDEKKCYTNIAAMDFKAAKGIEKDLADFKNARSGSKTMLDAMAEAKTLDGTKFTSNAERHAKQATAYAQHYNVRHVSFFDWYQFIAFEFQKGAVILDTKSKAPKETTGVCKLAFQSHDNKASLENAMLGFFKNAVMEWITEYNVAQKK